MLKATKLLLLLLSWILMLMCLHLLLMLYLLLNINIIAIITTHMLTVAVITTIVIVRWRSEVMWLIVSNEISGTLLSSLLNFNLWSTAHSYQSWVVQYNLSLTVSTTYSVVNLAWDKISTISPTTNWNLVASTSWHLERWLGIVIIRV